MCYLRVRSVQASSFLMEVVSYNTLVAALARQRRWQSAFAAAMSAPVQDKCERQAHRHTHTQRCAHFHSDTLNHRTHTFHRTPFPSHTRFRCVCVCPTLLPRGIFFDIADADGRKAGGQESASVCPGQRRPDTAEVQTYLHARSLKPCHAPQFKGPFAKIGLVTEHRAWLNQDVQTNRIGGCG